MRKQLQQLPNKPTNKQKESPIKQTKTALTNSFPDFPQAFPQKEFTIHLVQSKNWHLQNILLRSRIWEILVYTTIYKSKWNGIYSFLTKVFLTFWLKNTLLSFTLPLTRNYFPLFPLRKTCPYLELFWSAFFPHLDCIQTECRKMRTRITPNTASFYAGFLTFNEKLYSMTSQIW